MTETFSSIRGLIILVFVTKKEIIVCIKEIGCSCVNFSKCSDSHLTNSKYSLAVSEHYHILF